MNLPTILVAAVIAVIVLMIVIRDILNRKKGKGSCSCGCSGCSMSDMCHGKSK